MKQILTVIILVLCFCMPVMADSYMPLPDAVNSRMFSTDGSRPLPNLERTYFNNQAIRQIEMKQKQQNQDKEKIEQKNTLPEQENEKNGFKNLFKGFVIEY